MIFLLTALLINLFAIIKHKNCYTIIFLVQLIFIQSKTKNINEAIQKLLKYSGFIFCGVFILSVS